MKAAAGKVARKSAASPQPSSAGERALALSPPAYGIDFVDSAKPVVAPARRADPPEKKEEQKEPPLPEAAAASRGLRVAGAPPAEPKPPRSSREAPGEAAPIAPAAPVAPAATTAAVKAAAAKISSDEADAAPVAPQASPSLPAAAQSGGQIAAAPPAVRVPEPVAPVDAGGQPLPPDPSADDVVAQLAEQAQMLRTQAFALRQQAAEMRTNAQLLRTNIKLVSTNVEDSDSALTKAQEQNTARRGVVDQGPAALQASEAKAANVASRAPEGEARARQERARSQPMAGEASDLVAKSDANVPRDDPDAAAKAREQSGKLGKVSADIARVDDAVAQAGQAAGQLGQDAAHAKQQNSAAKAKIDAARSFVDENDARLGELQGRNTAASAELKALAEGPAKLQTEADALSAHADGLMERSQQIESQLHEIQASHASALRGVPAVPEPADAGELPAEAEGAGEETAEPEAIPETESADEMLEAGDTEAAGGDLEAQAGDTEAAAGPGAAPKPPPINLGKGLGWLTGEEEPTEEERRKAMLAEDERYKEALNVAAGSVDEDFSKLSAGEKRMRALRIVGKNLFGGVGKITWADVGKGGVKLAKALIDPRSTLAGVIGGLNMIANGVAGFVREPSWGGLLKAAADVALGLTIILGSITALAGLIIAAMVALSVVTVGAAAPVTGPVIAFCTTVMTTVGGWTFYVGLVAAGLQALVFLKDLYMAGTAKTADQLVEHADAMTQDASNTGNALLQAGMGKLAQVGGRQMQGAIAKAGGGVGFARQLGQRSLLGQAVRGSRLAARMSGGGRGARVLAGARIFGRGALRSARGTVRSIAGAGGRVAGRVGRGLRAARRLGFGRTARVLGQRSVRALGRGGRSLLGAARRMRQGSVKAWFREGMADIRSGFSRDFLTGEGAPIRAPGTRTPPPAKLAGAPKSEVPPDVTPPTTPKSEVPPDVTPPTTPKAEVPPDVTPPPTPKVEVPPDVTPPPAPKVDVPPDVAPPATPKAEVPPKVAPPAKPKVTPKAEIPASTVKLTRSQEAMFNRFMKRLQRARLSEEEALHLLGLSSRDELRTLVAAARTEEELAAALSARAEGTGATTRADLRAAGRSAPSDLPDPGLTISDQRHIPLRDVRAVSPSEALGNDLANEGFPMPGPGHHAHHGTPFRQLAEEMDWLHTQMEIEGLPQNTAGVGEWLPGTTDTPNVGGATPHLSNIHAGQGVARDYAYTLTERLYGKTGPEFINEYSSIMDEIGSGRFRHMRAPRGWEPGMPPPGYE